MPQFAIYRNPGRHWNIPFVVQIQSSRLERSVDPVVMPLVRHSGAERPDQPLTQHLHVEGEDVFANPFDLATVPATRPGTAFDHIFRTGDCARSGRDEERDQVGDFLRLGGTTKRNAAQSIYNDLLCTHQRQELTNIRKGEPISQDCIPLLA